MRIRRWTAPLVELRELHLCRRIDAVQVHEFVERAFWAALRTRAVVARDVEKERVVEFTHRIDCIDEPADFMIGVRRIRGIRFHLTRHHTTRVFAVRIPRCDLLWPRREFGRRRHDTERDLSRERFFSQFVPSLIKSTLVLRDPLRRNMVRRVRGTRREVHEKRLLWREGLLCLRPRDRLIRHVGREVVRRIARRIDTNRAVHDRGCPLVRFCGKKPVEPIEARACWPTIERPRHRRFPRRRFVRLSKRRGAVAVHPQNRRERRDVVRPHACVPWECRRELRDRAHVVHVVIAPCEQRRARRRTERRRVKSIETKPFLRESLEGGHFAWSAKCARMSESHVIDEHDDHVGRVRRHTHFKARRRCDLPWVDFGDHWNRRLRNRQPRAIKRLRWRCICSHGYRHGHVQCERVSRQTEDECKCRHDSFPSPAARA